MASPTSKCLNGFFVTRSKRLCCACACVCVSMYLCVCVCVCLALPAWCEFILQTITVKKHVYIAQIHAHTHTHTHTYLSPPTLHRLWRYLPIHSHCLTYQTVMRAPWDSRCSDTLHQTRLASLPRPLCWEPLCGCMCVCVLVEGYSILTLAHTATKGAKVGHARLANTL